MPWHQSVSEPRKVYDSRHEVACIAESPELATFITSSVNAAIVLGANAPIRLSEPAPVMQEPRQMDLVDADDCCGPKLVRALNRGVQGDSWLCPACGCEWKAAPENGVRRWSPVVHVEVLPPRGRG